MSPMARGLVTMELHRGDGSLGMQTLIVGRGITGIGAFMPPYQRPGTDLIPGTDDGLGRRPDNEPVTNLAKNLTDTTRAHAGRVAVRVDNAAMTYRALDEASARVAGLLHERGLKPGDRVGIMMPNVAGGPRGVLRGAPRRRRGRPDEPAAQGAGGRLLSGRLRGRAVVRLACVRGRGPRRRRGGQGGTHRRGRGQLPRSAGLRRPGLPGRGAGRRGHRGDPLHLRHDRPPEGRRAHPRQPHQQHRGGAHRHRGCAPRRR